MAKTNVSAIFIGIDDQVIELKGDELTTFLTDREERAVQFSLLEAEYQAKRDSRESAIKKLAEIAGLTEEELASIL
jgi:hypothetical protein